MANQRSFGQGPTEHGCSVEYTLSIIGGKWKGVILYHLMDRKMLRFSEFRRKCPSITQRMLTMQLRELEEDGILHREVYPQVPPKVEYSLTPLGETLLPIIRELKQWGDENRGESAASEAYGTQSAGVTE